VHFGLSGGVKTSYAAPIARQKLDDLQGELQLPHVDAGLGAADPANAAGPMPLTRVPTGIIVTPLARPMPRSAAEKLVTVYYCIIGNDVESRAAGPRLESRTVGFHFGARPTEVSGSAGTPGHGAKILQSCILLKRRDGRLRRAPRSTNPVN
jgi:hypothetical protein